MGVEHVEGVPIAARWFGLGEEQTLLSVIKRLVELGIQFSVAPDTEDKIGGWSLSYPPSAIKYED